MITKQTTLTQSNRRASGVARRQWRYVIGVGLAAGALLMTLALFVSQAGVPAAPAAPSAEQPVVGRSAVVTGLVFDGVHYISALIAPGAPRAGRDYTVTALVYDGTTYRTAPVRVQSSAFR
jgi:hypothetical protein